MIFPVITENLSWERLAKNLKTFKRWDRVKDEQNNFSIVKNLIFRLNVHGKPIYSWGIV